MSSPAVTAASRPAASAAIWPMTPAADRAAPGACDEATAPADGMNAATQTAATTVSKRVCAARIAGHLY
jgi:hypothetical protein